MWPYQNHTSWRMLPTLGYVAGSGQDTVTAPGANNAKGNWMLLSGQLRSSAHGLFVGLEVESGDATSRTYLADLAIGTAVAPTKTIVENMVISIGSSFVKFYMLHFPIGVAGPNFFWARYQTQSTGGALRMTVHPYAKNVGGSHLARVIALGADTANSRGTTITPGSGALTFGSWVDLTPSPTVTTGTSLPYKIHYVNISFGNAGDYVSNNQLYRVELGVRKAGNVNITTRLTVTPRWSSAPNSTPVNYHFPLSLPNGYIVSLRAAPEAAGSTDNLDAVVHGVG